MLVKFGEYAREGRLRRGRGVLHDGFVEGNGFTFIRVIASLRVSAVVLNSVCYLCLFNVCERRTNTMIHLIYSYHYYNMLLSINTFTKNKRVWFDPYPLVLFVIRFIKQCPPTRRPGTTEVILATESVAFHIDRQPPFKLTASVKFASS